MGCFQLHHLRKAWQVENTTRLGSCWLTVAARLAAASSGNCAKDPPRHLHAKNLPPSTTHTVRTTNPRIGATEQNSKQTKVLAGNADSLQPDQMAAYCT
jgi:hypothetical protein